MLDLRFREINAYKPITFPGQPAGKDSISATNIQQFIFRLKVEEAGDMISNAVKERVINGDPVADPAYLIVGSAFAGHAVPEMLPIQFLRYIKMMMLRNVDSGESWAKIYPVAWL
jgi:hypothetical protein